MKIPNFENLEKSTNFRMPNSDYFSENLFDRQFVGNKNFVISLK